MNLTLNPDVGFIIGVEIGVDFINVIGTDFSPKEILHTNEKTSLSMSVDEILELLIQRVKEAQKFCKEKVGGSFLGICRWRSWFSGLRRRNPSVRSEPQLAEC